MPSSMALGAGPLYTNAVMGQGPSALEREGARKANSTILRQDCIQIEQSDHTSRPESPWSIHYECANQAPYSSNPESKMNTKTSLLHLPKDNPSHDLAFFLRTTGPNAPHRRPSKLEPPRRGSSGSKNALRFLKMKRRSRQRVETVLRDEGGLLTDVKRRPLPKRAAEKVSSGGTKYLALQVENSPSILESSVSVSYVSDSEPLEDGYNMTKIQPHEKAAKPVTKLLSQIPMEHEAKVKRRLPYSSFPVRPAASSPPTAENASPVSIAGSDHYDTPRHPGRRSFDTVQPLSRRLVHCGTSASLPLPEISKSLEHSLEEHCNQQNAVDIKHPSPRRFASHPLLLQRASSIASSFNQSAISDSPGPPPRSPLRLRRDQRTIDGAMPSEFELKATPKIIPTIRALDERNVETRLIKPTVTTDCTGPIKRPRSRGKNPAAQSAYTNSRKDREERIRVRKLRDRPVTTRTIDSVVNAPPMTPRQRLKKARPHIQIPDLRPAPLATRASSSASSNASWKKVTEFTRTPVSAVPSEDTVSSLEQTGDAPILPTPRNGVYSDAMTLSPVMLVAEEIPLPKARTASKPSKLAVKDVKSYAPRPRSASLPRNSMQRRSRQGMRTPTRTNSPGGDVQIEEAPPLPSPPPTRALPPTPPASGSEKSSNAKQTATASAKRDIPILPLHEVPPNSSPARREEKVPHVVTQVQRRPVAPKDAGTTPEINARLEAVEKQNALLSAALNAVLRTNGAINHSRPTPVERRRLPMSWESRIARRSAACHTGSSSNGRALEMYMSTRQPRSQHRRL